MPKGNRGKRDYEREIKEASKRMKKYPEHLMASYNSNDWREFLIDTGISNDVSSKFWDNVRDNISGGFTVRGLAEQGIEVVNLVYRDAKGRFTKEITDRPVATYRYYETKKFVSPKKLEKR